MSVNLFLSCVTGAVVHLAREMTGAAPPAVTVARLCERHPDLRGKLPWVAAELEAGRALNAPFDWASIGLTRWLLRLGMARGPLVALGLRGGGCGAGSGGGGGDPGFRRRDFGWWRREGASAG